MNDVCNNNNAPRYSSTCDGIRNYHTVIFSVFGPLVALWVPPLIIAAYYYARTTDIYRKQEAGYAGNTVAAPTPVGSGGM